MPLRVQLPWLCARWSRATRPPVRMLSIGDRKAVTGSPVGSQNYVTDRACICNQKWIAPHFRPRNANLLHRTDRTRYKTAREVNLKDIMLHSSRLMGGGRGWWRAVCASSRRSPRFKKIAATRFLTSPLLLPRHRCFSGLREGPVGFIGLGNMGEMVVENNVRHATLLRVEGLVFNKIPLNIQ